MSEVKIDNLPQDADVTGSECVPATDNGTTKKVLISDIGGFAVALLMGSDQSDSVSGCGAIVRDRDGRPRVVPMSVLDSAIKTGTVSLTADQSVAGVKTFTGTVKVPSPSSATDAATKQYVDQGLSGKVSAVQGKGLSSNDFTDALKQKLEAIGPGHGAAGVESVNEKTGVVSLSAVDVGAADRIPEIMKASSLVEPANGDTASAIFGKCWKAISSLISHIGDAGSHVSQSDRSSWNGKADAFTIDGSPAESSLNPVSSAGVHFALSKKQDELQFDIVPTFGSKKMVTSGAVLEAIEGKFAESRNEPMSSAEISSSDATIPLMMREDPRSHFLVRETCEDGVDVSPIVTFSHVVRAGTHKEADAAYISKNSGTVTVRVQPASSVSVSFDGVHSADGTFSVEAGKSYMIKVSVYSETIASQHAFVSVVSM